MKLQSERFYRIPSKEEILQFASYDFEIFNLFHIRTVAKKRNSNLINTETFKDRTYTLIKEREIEERNPNNEYFYRYIDHVVDIYDNIYRYSMITERMLTDNEYRNFASYIIYIDHVMKNKLDFDIIDDIFSK